MGELGERKRNPPRGPAIGGFRLSSPTLQRKEGPFLASTQSGGAAMQRVRIFRAVLGLSLALGGASTALAQATVRPAEGQGGPESLAGLLRQMGAGPQTPITVLMAPAVQQELKLTETQKGKVFNLSVAAMQKQRDQ